MRSSSRPTRRAFLIGAVVGLLVLAVFVLGALAGGPLREAITGTKEGSLPDQVTQIVGDRYRGAVDQQALERAGAKAIAESLGDPYTAYLTPQEWARLQRASEGQYTGIGIRVRREDGALAVQQVFAGSPAAKAGLRAGDAIVAVGGIPVAKRGYAKSVQAILGKAGTTVALRVRAADGTVRTVRAQRGDVEVPMVETRMATGPGGTKVGVITLERFERGAGGQVRTQAQRLIRQGASALVLDLRGDPGGLLDEAVAVSSVFLAEDQVVVSTEGRASPERVFRAEGNPISADVPVAVLVDGNSASASEIVAGALKDHGRAVIVGEPTFGKSKVQVTQGTSDGGAVRVTIATYLTPKGTDIGDGGVKPDVRTSDAPATKRDEALDRALAALAAKAG